MPDLPLRIKDRPQPELWKADELLTLEEAAVLFWPDGPLTVRTLRTAIRNNELGHIVVARKFFVTPRLIEAMCKRS